MENQVELQRIFNPSGCLTQEALDDYVAGKTLPEVTRRIEHHITECPFCSDAVEGYMDNQDIDNTHRILEETKAKLFGQQEETKVIGLAAAPMAKKKVSTRALYWGIAATVVVLTLSYVAVRFIIPASDQKELGLMDPSKVEEEKTTVATDSPATMYEKLKEESRLPGGAGNGGPMMDGVTLDMEEDINMVDRRDADENLEYFSKVTESDNLIVDDLQLFQEGKGSGQPIQDSKEESSADETEFGADKDVTTVIAESTTKNNRSNEFLGSGKKSDLNTNAPSAASGEVQQQVNDGLNAYNAGDYPTANEKFQEALGLSPDQDQALFYSGMSYFNTAQYDLALPLFEKILKRKNSSYYQSAQWQIAQIYVKQGETRQARKALNEVIDMNGTYREAAEKQIDQLPD